MGKQVDQDSERKIFVDLDVSRQLTAKNVQELGRLVFLGHQGLKMRLVLGTHALHKLQSDKQTPTMEKIVPIENQNIHLDRAAWCDYDPSEITLYGA